MDREQHREPECRPLPARQPGCRAVSSWSLTGGPSG